MGKRNKTVFFVAISVFLLLLGACGPSQETVAKAQQKYAQMVEIHNEVVEAHRQIKDNSLDQALRELGGRAAAMKDYNLSEMKEEEIDRLVADMDSIIASYKEYQTMISDLKAQEDAAVRTMIPVKIYNGSSFSFEELRLYEKGEGGTQGNALEGMEPFAPGQTLEGLAIRRNVENTPWLLSLLDTEGGAFEISLPVEEYGEEGISLVLSYDAEQAVLSAEPADGEE